MHVTMEVNVLTNEPIVEGPVHVSFTSHTDIRSFIARTIFELGGSARPSEVYAAYREKYKDQLTEGDLISFGKMGTKKEPRFQYQLRFQVHPQMSNPDCAGIYLLIKPSKDSNGLWILRDDAISKMVALEIISQKEANEYRYNREQGFRAMDDARILEDMIRSQFPKEKTFRDINYHLLSERSENYICQLKKNATIHYFGNLQCEVCEIIIMRAYGFIPHHAHVHHLIERCTHSEGYRSSCDDLIIVCPTCHEVVHKTGQDFRTIRTNYFRKTGKTPLYLNGVPSVTQEQAEQYHRLIQKIQAESRRNNWY